MIKVNIKSFKESKLVEEVKKGDIATITDPDALHVGSRVKILNVDDLGQIFYEVLDTGVSGMLSSQDSFSKVNESKKESLEDFSDVVFYSLGELQKQGKLGGFSIDTEDSMLADNELLLKLDNPGERVNVVAILEVLKTKNEIANYYVNPDDSIIVTALAH